jgi:hypothetical protein
MMLAHGYLSYLANDAAEAVNGDIDVLYHRHGQKGGKCGRGRRAKETDAIMFHCIRKVMWVTGKAQERLRLLAEAKVENAKRPALRDNGFRGGRNTSDEWVVAHARATAKRQRTQENHLTVAVPLAVRNVNTILG